MIKSKTLSLSERIAERQLKKQGACSSHKNRATIISLRQDIQYALNEGWSALSIYKVLVDEGKVNFSYQSFRRYVNRIIQNNPSNNSNPDKGDLL